jgi:hypothetical protein
MLFANKKNQKSFLHCMSFVIASLLGQNTRVYEFGVEQKKEHKKCQHDFRGKWQ